MASPLLPEFSGADYPVTSGDNTQAAVIVDDIGSNTF